MKFMANPKTPTITPEMLAAAHAGAAAELPREKFAFEVKNYIDEMGNRITENSVIYGTLPATMPRFVGHTSAIAEALDGQKGRLPVTGKIDAPTIQEAFAIFPEAMMVHATETLTVWEKEKAAARAAMEKQKKEDLARGALGSRIHIPGTRDVKAIGG
jgi:hypothetical protein